MRDVHSDDFLLLVQELKREQVEEQRRAAAAARQELKEERKAKQAAAGPAPSMALRTAASLQRALSNGDDADMFWDYGQSAGLRTGMCSTSCHAPLCRTSPPVSQVAVHFIGRSVSCLVRAAQSPLKQATVLGLWHMHFTRAMLDCWAQMGAWRLL